MTTPVNDDDGTPFDHVLFRVMGVGLLVLGGYLSILYMRDPTPLTTRDLVFLAFPLGGGLLFLIPKRLFAAFKLVRSKLQGIK